jgi:hypothetical protein
MLDILLLLNELQSSSNETRFASRVRQAQTTLKSEDSLTAHSSPSSDNLTVARREAEAREGFSPLWYYNAPAKQNHCYPGVPSV